MNILKVVAIKHGAEPMLYLPVGQCIYCGSEIYSHKPNQRRNRLGAEHIVPEGLGGNLVLPDASCQKCESKTGSVVEGKILGDTLYALRAHLNIRQKKGRPYQKSIYLRGTINGKNGKVNVPLEDYPIVFNMPMYPPPKLSGERASGHKINGMRVVRVRHDAAKLVSVYGVSSFMTPPWHNLTLCRMLAKIAHSFAVAELGQSAYEPLLLDLIKKANGAHIELVGGTREQFEQSPDALHLLAIGFQVIEDIQYVVVRVQLFTNFDGPVYQIVVGKSLVLLHDNFRLPAVT